MATVARVEGPSVAVEETPFQYQKTRLDPGYNDGIARGLQQVGGVVEQIAAREQDKADTASVLEAQRKLSDFERVWFDPANPQGVYASQGRNALGLVDKVAPDFDRVQSELTGSLKSPRAREAFTRYASSKREGMLDRVNGYSVREHDGYVQAEFQASIANSVESAATAALEGRYQDQAREVQLGLQNLRAQAAATGEPREATEVKERGFLSTVHATAVNGLLAKGQVIDAAAYFDANAEDIGAEMVGQLQARMRPLLIDAAANAILDGMPGGVTPESIGGDQTVETLWPHLVHQESRGSQAAVSPKGAMGVAQIMPDTGPVAAKMAGLPWDPERCRTDPAYNAALGKAYLTAQMETFGSAPLALAAYNAGPGKVQNWLARFGDPRKGEISLPAFVASIPYKETRDYVQSITAAAGGPSAAEAAPPAASPPGEPGGSLAAQLAGARRYADPALRAQVEQGIRSRWTVMEQDRQERDRATRQTINGSVESMDPRGSLAKTLPPDQYAYAAQNGLLSGLEARLRERVQGVDPVTPPDVLASLHRIFYDAAQGTTPGRQAIARAEVAKMDVLSLPLSPKDRDWAEQTRAAVLKPQTDVKAVNFASEGQILDAVRSKLKIPSGQAGDPQWGPFLVQYLDAKRTATARKGSDLNAEEQQQIIDRLTVPFVRDTFFGNPGQGPGVPAYKAKVSDIPADARERLAASARRLLKREPTEAELVAGYTLYRQANP